MSTTINHEQFVLDGDYQTSVQKLEAVAAAVPAFTILGKKTNDGAISVAAAVADGAGAEGANTGTGTCTKDATAPAFANALLGSYRVVVTRAYVGEGTVAGAYAVYDPLGNHIGDGVIGDTWANQIKFVLAEDGETKFIVGDAFLITVAQAAASNDLAAWDPTASDGSEVPYGILAAEAPKNVAAQYVSVYISGRFNADKVVVPTNVDVDSAFDALREKGIYLIHQADTERNPAVVEE